MATAEEIDQQRRVVNDHKSIVSELLGVLAKTDVGMTTYVRLGLGDDAILDPDAFDGTGTTVAVYRAAIGSLDAIKTLLASGHGTNLEKLAR